MTQNFVNDNNLETVIDFLKKKDKLDLWDAFKEKMEEKFPDAFKEALVEKKGKWDSLVGSETGFTF